MRIGILTYHRAHNYGAYLQACALCNRLNQEADIQAEIIDFRMCKEAKRYSYNWSIPARILYLKMHRFLMEKAKGFERALNDDILTKSSEFCQSDKIEDFISFVEGKYDVIIAGSDEIWNFNNFRGFPNPYWLIGDLKCRKFSYAASSRQDFSKISPETKDGIIHALNDFEYIGVRDQLTLDSIVDLLGDASNVHLCCDPSFVYDFSVPEVPIASINKKLKNLDSKKKNAFVMVSDHKLAKLLKQQLHSEYNLISVCDCHSGFINVPNLTPSEWLMLLKNCDLVLTTYFHATCFSIINDKPFISLASSKRSSKIEDLLVSANLTNKHYVDDYNSIENLDCLRDKISKAYDLCGCAEYVNSQRVNFESFVEALRG